jgi:hypothetical protein
MVVIKRCGVLFFYYPLSGMAVGIGVKRDLVAFVYDSQRDGAALYLFVRIDGIYLWAVEAFWCFSIHPKQYVYYHVMILTKTERS